MQARCVSPSLSVDLRRLAWRAAAWPAVAAVVAGCSPALDWRETRLKGPGLEATFPCRPVGQARQIELAGRLVTMQLDGCEAGGRTFAVGWADVGDPAAVGPALQALRQASAGKAVDRPARPRTDWAAPHGATPQAAAGRWELRAAAPDGAVLAMDTAVFARGTWVVQASVIGPEPGPAAAAALAPFFEGLRFAP
jgi:hypothetical protein